LLVNPEGSGGARHAGKAGNTVMMMACDMRDDSISLDDAWWDPIGMRASVSFKVNFDQTFLSEKDVLGYPGQYLEEEWQTRFSPHYGATYMGGAEAAYELALNYIRKQNKQADPYIQHRVAKMHLNIETGKMWLQKVASLWESGQIDAAKNAGNSARYLLEQLATETVDHAVHACGARSMIRPSALERIYRDLSFYARHDNDDQVLAIVGKTVLGIDHDKSFFNPDQKQK
ncbi:MAG: acyl-CoA dehydrogenase family protein, partial [Bacteroidota bacterium]